MGILSLGVCFLGHFLLRGFVARDAVAAVFLDPGRFVPDSGSLDRTSLVSGLHKSSYDRCCFGGSHQESGISMISCAYGYFVISGQANPTNVGLEGDRKSD